MALIGKILILVLLLVNGAIIIWISRAEGKMAEAHSEDERYIEVKRQAMELGFLHFQLVVAALGLLCVGLSIFGHFSVSLDNLSILLLLLFTVAKALYFYQLKKFNKML